MWLAVEDAGAVAAAADSSLGSGASVFASLSGSADGVVASVSALASLVFSSSGAAEGASASEASLAVSYTHLRAHET